MVFTLPGPPPAESLSEAGAAANRGGRPRCCQAADLAGREAATAQAVGLEFQLWVLPAFFLARQTGGGGGDYPAPQATPTWEENFSNPH